MKAPGSGPLTEDGAVETLEDCLGDGGSGQIGLEIELLTYLSDSPGMHCSSQALEDLVAELQPRVAGFVSLEPGGQIELSSRPCTSLQGLRAEVESDLDMMRTAAQSHCIELIGLGLDDRLPLRRILDNPRYRAMERYFRPWAPSGTQMMCASASLQVGIDAGESRPETRKRWAALHAIGPAMVATFANSPDRGRSAPAWRSGRNRMWSRIDPLRTGPRWQDSIDNPERAYARWALDAPLMLINRDHAEWDAPASVTFRDWIRFGQDAVPDRVAPTLSDLELHLTTLFPAVRARGYLEARYLDAVPPEWAIVPAAALAILSTDDHARDAALSECDDLSHLWSAAARDGLSHPRLRVAADRLLDVVANRLRDSPDSRQVAHRVDAYRERWTARGLSPADDTLDGSRLPSRDTTAAVSS